MTDNFNKWEWTEILASFRQSRYLQNSQKYIFPNFLELDKSRTLILAKNFKSVHLQKHLLANVFLASRKVTLAKVDPFKVNLNKRFEDQQFFPPLITTIFSTLGLK